MVADAPRNGKLLRMICLRRVVLSVLLVSVAAASEATAAPRSGQTTQSRNLRVQPGRAEKPANLGLTVRNAKFANFGAYLQRIVEAVQTEWDSLLAKTRSRPPAGTYVTVPFVLNSSGAVVRFDAVDSKSDKLGIQIAVSAVANCTPFGTWTDEMKHILKTEEQLRLTFYYP